MFARDETLSVLRRGSKYTVGFGWILEIKKKKRDSISIIEIEPLKNQFNFKG